MIDNKSLSWWYVKGSRVLESVWGRGPCLHIPDSSRRACFTIQGYSLALDCHCPIPGTYIWELEAHVLHCLLADVLAHPLLFKKEGRIGISASTHEEVNPLHSEESQEVKGGGTGKVNSLLKTPFTTSSSQCAFDCCVISNLSFFAVDKPS